MTTTKSRARRAPEAGDADVHAEVAAIGMDMTALIAAVAGSAAPLETVPVDIGAYLSPPQPPGAAVLTLRDLDAPRLFQTGDDAEAIRRLNPEWPQSLAFTVALLAQAHAGPPLRGTPAAEFYMGVANANRRLLSHLITEYKKAFPEAVTIGGDEAEAKNG